MNTQTRHTTSTKDLAQGLFVLVVLSIALSLFVLFNEVQAQTPFKRIPVDTNPVRRVQYEAGDLDSGFSVAGQTDGHVLAKSSGCINCHAGQHDPHFKESVKLGCTDCHGGNAQAIDKTSAHIHPRFPQAWPSSANPPRSYTLLNRESPEFIQFVNPGDLRVAKFSCGTSGCHGEIVDQVGKNMMTHGAMLWNAALYNNGAIPNKHPRYGESYSTNGTPQRLLLRFAVASSVISGRTAEGVETEKRGEFRFDDRLILFNKGMRI